MSARTKKLLKEALSLPKAELADFLDDLSLAFTEFEDPAIAAEWEAEIARRVEDLEAGRVKPIPWSKVWRDLTTRQKKATRASAARRAPRSKARSR